jgi:glycosyltransferase involved in cell wall biosynthesis
LKNAEDLKITIITVCKNSERFLDETIKSVINQTYKNIQYIIIDGNSTDATVEIIKEHLASISFWISEEDSGMYDAINKGLKLSTGNYILILNSDDVLAHNETIRNIVQAIDNERLDYYYGNIIKSKNGKYKKVKLFPVSFPQLLLSTHGTFVPHPCFLISAKLNNELNGYDPQYKYASDYDYILRALSAPGSKGKYIDIYISKFRIHENSITAGGNIDKERKIIIFRHGYFQYNYFSRWASYYTLWIYYKLINLRQGYKEAQV